MESLKKPKFSQGNNFFFHHLSKKAYFIPSAPKNNIEMKNILRSCKSSQPLWSVPCGGRKATRASFPKEENAAARQINAGRNPKEWAFFFSFFL